MSLRQAESDTMRVLEILGSVDPRHGGPTEGVIRQALARRHHGFDTHIASLDAPDDPWLSDCPVPTFGLGPRRGRSRRLPWRRYGYSPRFVPWLRDRIHDYDVAVVNGLWNYSVCAARRVLIGADVPYVVFAHGMLDPWLLERHPLKHAAKRISFAAVEKPVLDHARSVLFATEDERTRARAGNWPFRAPDRVVGYGTSDLRGDPDAQVEAFRALVPETRGRRLLLFLGRIHPIKGCDLLIAAFAAHAAAHPDVDLVIAGPDPVGWRATLEQHAATLGIAARVHWPGMLQGDAKWGAFRACHAFALPSHSESFGVVVAEALSASAAVLITDKVPLWREIAADGAGWVGSDDVPSLRRVVGDLLSSSTDRVAIVRAAARACFLKRYEISIAVHRFVDALREAAADTRTATS